MASSKLPPSQDMKRHHDVLAQSQFAAFGRRGIGDDIAFLDAWPLTTAGRWSMQVDLVGALVFAQIVGVQCCRLFRLHDNLGAGHRDDFAIFFCNDHLARIQGSIAFHAG